MTDRRDPGVHRMVMDWPDDAVAEIESLRARAEMLLGLLDVRESELVAARSRLAEAERGLKTIAEAAEERVAAMDSHLNSAWAASVAREALHKMRLADSAPAVGAARYRLQAKADPYKWADFDAKLWNLIVVPADQPKAAGK